MQFVCVWRVDLGYQEALGNYYVAGQWIKGLGNGKATLVVDRMG